MVTTIKNINSKDIKVDEPILINISNPTNKKTVVPTAEEVIQKLAKQQTMERQQKDNRKRTMYK